MVSGKSLGASDEGPQLPLWKGDCHAIRQCRASENVSHLKNHHLWWLALSLLYSARDFRAIIPCLACRECIPSGALTLDIALGGGFPKGRIIEVGSPACSSTSVLIHVVMPCGSPDRMHICAAADPKLMTSSQSATQPPMLSSFLLAQ